MPERTSQAKADIVGYTKENSLAVRSWIDSEETWQALSPGREFPPPENVVDSWQSAKVSSYVLMSANKIVAYGELWDKPQRLAVEISHLLVDPFKRGEGYGTKMLELLFQRASRRQGVSQVLINLLGEDQDILSCYLKAGFEIVGTTSHTTGLRLTRVVE